MDLRLVFGLILSLMLTGCSLTSSLTDLASEKMLVKIDSNTTPTHVNTGNLGVFPIAGQCPEGATQVSLTSPVSATFPCVNGQFSGLIDLSAIPDGDSSLTLVPDSGTTKTWNIKKDTTAPTVALDPVAASVNSSSVTAFPVSGTCSEEGRFVYVEAGALQFPLLCSSGSFSGSLNFWSLSEGSVNLSAKLRDEAGNESTDTESTTKDTLAPSLSLSSAVSNPFNAGSFAVTATFSESVTGFALSDISVTNGAASGLSGSGATYTFTVTPAGQGTVTVAVADSVAQDSAGNDNTAAANLNRIFDTVAPTITGLSNDPAWKSSKTWTWGCDETCTYRFVVDTSVGTSPSGTFDSTTTTTQSSGSGTYYLHVEARDAAGNTSVAHVSTLLDNTLPNAPTSLNDQLYSVSLTQSPVVTFTSGTDAHSGLQKHQARVVRDSDGQEMSPWADFTSGSQISGLSLATNTVYKVEFKSIDNLGLESTVVQSDGWIADTTAPAAPTGLGLGTIPSALTTSPPLSWTAATDTGGSGVSSYEARIFRTSDDVAMSGWTALSSGGTISGLSLAVASQYYFKVRAIDNVGNVGSESIASSSWNTPLIIDFIVVGGGGSGGNFSGGGAGGIVHMTNYSLASGTYTITVGAGGAFPAVSSGLDANGGTTVYNVGSVAGNAGASSSFGAIATATGGAAGNGAAVGGATGSGTGPSGAVIYSRASGGRPGAGAGSATNGSYGGGTGVTITLGGVQSFTLGGGGSGSAYWNVGGSTPGGNTAGGSSIGGRSGLIAGDRDNGVNPDAGIGNPPANNGAYITGGDGVANTGSGGGSSSSAEVLWNNGAWGVKGGSGGSGVVIIGYPGTVAYPFGGEVTITGGYVTHKFTSSTSLTY